VAEVDGNSDGEGAQPSAHSGDADAWEVDPYEVESGADRDGASTGMQRR
jgi:hypothetical protein